MPVETRYFRSDSHTINGLSGRKLLTSQSGAGACIERVYSDPEGTIAAVIWGIRVYRRRMDGQETEITSDVSARVSRTTAGVGLQSAQWTCPETSLLPTDAIVVRVYIGVQDLGGGISWDLADVWITEQLGASKLDAVTWTVYYYTYLSIVTRPVRTLTARFCFDSSTYNSRIEGFSWSPAIAVAVAGVIGDGLSCVVLPVG